MPKRQSVWTRFWNWFFRIEATAAFASLLFPGLLSGVGAVIAGVLDASWKVIAPLMVLTGSLLLPFGVWIIAVSQRTWMPKLRGVDQQTQIVDTQQNPLLEKATRRERARHLREVLHEAEAVIKSAIRDGGEFGNIRSRVLELHRKMDQQIRGTSWAREFGYRQGSRELTDFTSTGIITEVARQIKGTRSDPQVRQALDKLIAHLTTMGDRVEQIIEDMQRD